MQTVTSIVLNNFQNDSRVLKENISLQKTGYTVQVVALHEELLKEFDKVQNVPVHRIQLKSRGWSKNKLIQLLKYFEFIYRVVTEYKNSDIIHCNDLNALPVGVIIKKFFNKNTKIVYDAHEYETETNGLKGVRKTLTKKLEKFLIKYADKVICVSDAIANEYVKLYNIKKPALVLNTPPFQEIEKKDIFREIFDIKKDQTIFLYQGGLSSGRGIEILLDTFKELDVYQYKKSLINGIFNDFNKSEIDTSIKILIQLQQPVPTDLQYLKHLYSKYPKNNKSQHKQALKELIAEHFPNMSSSNIEAIASV